MIAVTRVRATFAALALALSGGAAKAAATPHDTIIMGKGIDDIISLDPAEVYEASGSEVVGNLYDRLIEFDPLAPAKFAPSLAVAWQAEEDGRSFRFTLRPDARFANGDPVTAGDAAFSLQRAIRLNKAPALVLQQLGLSPANVMDRVHAVDEHTLVIETSSAVAPGLVLACLTATVASIVDRTEVMAHEQEGDLGSSWLAGHSAGSGPYRLVLWRPGEHYTLEANDGYWGGAPANRRVIVRQVKEAATQRLMLLRGDIDYARDLDKDQLDALAGNPAFRVDRGIQNLITYLALNQRNGFLRRPEVIEAIKYLVDYDGMEEAILGGTRIMHQSFEPQGFLGAIEDRPFRHDPARARALLVRAGLGDGFDVTIDVRNAWPSMDLAQALQADFAAANVRLAIVPGDGKQILTKYRARHHDIFLGEWGPDYPDPHSNAEAFVLDDDMSDGAAKKTPAWRNAWADPAMSKLVLEAAAERDPARRAELYAALQRRHQHEAPFIFMYEFVEVAAHASTVDGFVIGSGPGRNRYAGIAKH